MVPLIEREVVNKRKWIEVKELTDVLALAQSLPGAIAINTATFVGYRMAGVLGAIVATIGVLLPTFIIVLALGIFFLQVQHHPKIEAAFTAIRATIVALITYAAIRIGRKALVDRISLVIILATVLGLIFLPLHPIVMLAAGAIAGIVIVFLRDRFGRDQDLPSDDREEKRRDTYREEHSDYYYGEGI